MKKGRLYNREEIEVISKSAIGKSINDIINEEVITISESKVSNKGSLGQLVEQFLFGIQNNNESEPDFMPAGIELKVTPYKKIKGGKLSSKERLVLNVINYMDEYKNNFESSHFWFKNKAIQILWYLWEPNKSNKDLKITHEILLELSENTDLNQIKEDWEHIIKKIKDGKAHEISEADTMYLGACPKGINASSVRKQPFSDIPAMQRAFCFKNSYMIQLVRKYIGDYSNVERLLNNKKETLINYINNVTKKYIGKSQLELINEFLLDETSKNTKGIYPMIINRMFKLNGNIENTDEFKKANIKLKTIRVEKNGSIRESMSFPTFEFKEIIKEEWDNSKLREEFETTKYLLCVFKNNGHDYVFKGIKLWNMPESTINNEVKTCWLKTKNIVLSGIKFNVTSNGVKNNLPGISDNGIIHVRPHAAKSAYKLNNGYKRGDITKYASELPNGEWMTKQCFWLNREYIKAVISEII